MTKKITGIQCGLLLCLTTISLKFLAFPSVFANYAGKDVYFSVLIGLMLDFSFALIMLWVLKQNPHLTFFELIKRAFGKVVASVLLVCLFLYFFFRGVLVVKEIHNYFNETLFENIEWLMFVIPLFALIAFMMLKDFRTFGRTVQFFMPLIALALLFTILVPASEADFSNILPVFEYGVKNTFNAVLRCSFIFGDYLILFVLMGKIKFTPDAPKKVLTCVVITYTLVILFYIVFASVFGDVGINHSLALSDLLLYTSIITETGTINWINIIIWLIILFLEVGLMFLSASKTLTEAFNFKNRYIPTVLICVLLFISIVYLYLNLIRAIEIVTSLWFSISVIAFQVMLPILSVIATLKLRGKNKVTLRQVYNQRVVKYQLTNIVPSNCKTVFSNKKIKRVKNKKPSKINKEVQNA